MKVEHLEDSNRLQTKITFNILTLNKYLLPMWPPHFKYADEETEEMYAMALEHAKVLMTRKVLTNEKFVRKLKGLDVEVSEDEADPEDEDEVAGGGEIEELEEEKTGSEA